MPDTQEVVIVGADGKEHVFPPGFDPKQAAAIVRGGGDTGGGFMAGARQALEAAQSGLAGPIVGTVAKAVPGIVSLAKGIQSDPASLIEQAPGLISGRGASTPQRMAVAGLAGVPAKVLADVTRIATNSNLDKVGSTVPEEVGNVLRNGLEQAGMEGAFGAAKLAGKGIKNVGTWLRDKAVSPSRSVMEGMAEARGKTIPEMQSYLGDQSERFGYRPSPASIRPMLDKVAANNAEQKGMERAAWEAGNTVKTQDVLAPTVRDSLTYTKPGDVLPMLRKDTRPEGAIRATKDALIETVKNRDMSVPFEEWTSRQVPTEMRGWREVVDQTPAVRGLLDAPPVPDGEAPARFVNASVVEPFTVRDTATVAEKVGSRTIPNPALDPQVLGDITRGVNAKLVDAFGADPKTKAEIVVDRNFAANSRDVLDKVTQGLGPRSRSEIGSETHDLLNLINAYRHTYSASTAPMRLYEFMGMSMGDPVAASLGTLSRRGPQWYAGRGLRKAGDAVSENAAAIPQIIRAAMLAKLKNEQPQ